MRELAALALLVPLAAAAQAGGKGAVDSPRHAYVKRHGVAPKYAHARNPLQPSAPDIEAGRKLYLLHCQICHGESGRGSEAGRRLDPPTTSLVGHSQRRIASDAFYDWTIAEGGVPVRSSMPPFKNVLKQEEIWKIVLFLRTL